MADKPMLEWQPDALPALMHLVQAHGPQGVALHFTVQLGVTTPTQLRDCLFAACWHGIEQVTLRFTGVDAENSQRQTVALERMTPMADTFGVRLVTL